MFMYGHNNRFLVHIQNISSILNLFCKRCIFHNIHSKYLMDAERFARKSDMRCIYC